MHCLMYNKNVNFNTMTLKNGRTMMSIEFSNNEHASLKMLQLAKCVSVEQERVHSQISYQ